MPSLQKKKLPAFSIQSDIPTSDREDILWISALKTLLDEKRSIEKKGLKSFEERRKALMMDEKEAQRSIVTGMR